MKKQKLMHRSILFVVLFVLMASVLTACGSGDKTLSGSYHTEANGYKRGADVAITKTGDSITIIIDDMDSEYSITDPEGMQLQWPVKQTVISQELQNMGEEEIAKIQVEVDDQGIPTSIENFNVDIIPDGCTDCAGMLILAVQDAFAK